MLPVRDAELHVTALTEVALQPGGFTGYLVQDAKHELLGGDRGGEYTDILSIGNSGVGPCLDEGITQTRVASNVGQEQG